MKVKKFVAPSMQEAMKKIRFEMGNDAVILNSKVNRTGGFLGLFTKTKIEVIAAIDPDIPSRGKAEITRTFKERTVQPIPAADDVFKKETIKTVEGEMKNEQLLEEIKELKELIQTISGHEKPNQYPESLEEIYQELIKNDMNEKIVHSLLTELLLDLQETNLPSERLKNKLEELFFSKLDNLEFGGISFQKKYINVIGPTGVGKTTTLAKLAALCVFQKKKKVAFITTDTYRIAAIEQLKKYATILDVPIEVCYNIEDFKLAKQKLNSYDYVFIDTAGRNFQENHYVRDLHSIIEFNHDMETFLVLAATAKPIDMINVYKQFSSIPIDKLIFTKLDETSTKGPLYEVVVETKKGVAYTTHGQNVPNDIEEATKELIIQQVLR